MVKLVELSQDELDKITGGGFGKTVITKFIKTGKAAMKVDTTGMKQTLMTMNSSLTLYAKRKELPVKVIQRKGELILLRTDMEQE